MPRIKFTSALSRYFPGLADREIEGSTVKEVLDNLEMQYPGLRGYLTEDNGQLRKHVNIFLGSDLILDRQSLTDTIGPKDEVLIFQALSGG